MSMKLVNIRMDEDLKKEMEIVCNDLGINITTAFTIFAKKLTREKRIPFSVSVDPFYSNENIKALENSINEVKDDKVIMKTIEELEAMEGKPEKLNNNLTGLYSRRINDKDRLVYKIEKILYYSVKDTMRIIKY